MPTANKTHDLAIVRSDPTFSGGYVVTGFMVEPGTWQRKRINDFVERIASSGVLRRADLSYWSNQGFESWEHGFGVEYVRSSADPSRFYKADDDIETTIAGQVTMAAKWASSDTDFAAKCWVDHGSYVYA